MTQVDSPTTFIHAIRSARSDGYITAEELRQPLREFATAGDVSDDVKGHVVGDLLMTARSRGRRGGLRLGPGADSALARFVGAHDKNQPGLWLDPPRRSQDAVSGFINAVRRESKRGISGREMDRALAGLARSPSRELRAHVAENLMLAHHRDPDQIRLSSSAEDALNEFVDEHDPRRQGLGWFEPAE